jgi:hypothetical protein
VATTKELVNGDGTTFTYESIMQAQPPEVPHAAQFQLFLDEVLQEGTAATIRLRSMVDGKFLTLRNSETDRFFEADSVRAEQHDQIAQQFHILVSSPTTTTTTVVGDEQYRGKVTLTPLSSTGTVLTSACCVELTQQTDTSDFDGLFGMFATKSTSSSSSASTAETSTGGFAGLVAQFFNTTSSSMKRQQVLSLTDVSDLAVGQPTAQLLVRHHGVAATEEMSAFIYDVDLLEMSVEPWTFGEISLVNETPVGQAMAMIDGWTIINSQSFVFGSSIVPTFSADFQTKVPKIIDGVVSFILPVRFAWDVEKTRLESRDFDMELPISVPPYSSVMGKVLGSKGTIGIPFSTTMTRQHSDGLRMFSREYTVHGQFTGTEVFQIEAVVTLVEEFDHNVNDD